MEAERRLALLTSNGQCNVVLFNILILCPKQKQAAFSSAHAVCRSITHTHTHTAACVLFTHAATHCHGNGILHPNTCIV